MIDARELRIGNLVNHTAEGKYNSITISIKSKFYKIDASDIVSASRCEAAGKQSEFEGIPLTPEILEKCGEIYPQPFEWQFRVKISAISILFRQNSDIWYSELGGIYLGDKIQYLHQLQNLYWCLTGKELEIKL